MKINSLNKFIITWIAFIPIAILNGVLREVAYKQFTGDLVAHQISTAIAIISFFLLVNIMLREEIKKISYSEALAVGLLWLILTIVFEFGFGHFIDKASWESLLSDYNIFTGHLWGLFLITILITPRFLKLVYKTKRER